MSGLYNTVMKPIKKGIGALTGRNDAKAAQRDAANAQRDALAQEKEIAAKQEQQNLALQNMQANAQVDLSTDNLTSVVAGGMADLASSAPDGVKKKRQAGGLASSLGLNV